MTLQELFNSISNKLHPDFYSDHVMVKYLNNGKEDYDLVVGIGYIDKDGINCICLITNDIANKMIAEGKLNKEDFNK